MTIRDWFNKEVDVGQRVYVDTAKEAMEGEVVVNYPRLKSWACESKPTEEVVVAIDAFH